MFVDEFLSFLRSLMKMCWRWLRRGKEGRSWSFLWFFRFGPSAYLFFDFGPSNFVTQHIEQHVFHITCHHVILHLLHIRFCNRWWRRRQKPKRL